MTHSDYKVDRPVSGFLKSWFVKLDKRDGLVLNSARFMIVLQLSGLLFVLFFIIGISFSLFPTDVVSNFSTAVRWLSVTAILLTLSLAYSIWKSLLDPLLRICRWADLMRGVNLDATVSFDPKSDFSELASDINMLGKMINQLSSETEAQLQKHTDFISRESRSLVIMYEVASSINLTRDLNALFDKSLESLCKNLHASAGIIRQAMDGKDIEVVATCGKIKSDFLTEINNLLPFRAPLKASSSAQSFYTPNSLSSIQLLDLTNQQTKEDLLVVSVPIQYRDFCFGTINLFFPQQMRGEIDNYLELFASIGQHLGTAIEKHRLDEDENQSLVMQERTRFSHELHDSLAQTMASLRIQVRILDEVFQGNDEPGIWEQLERVEYTVEQANEQVRELIAYFGIPMNKHGLISSIEEELAQVRDETDMQVYLQNKWSNHELPSNIELQVLRITQECIANIRKHSRARSVRVLLRADRVGGGHHLLIEDDGAGFDETKINSVGGEQLGLGILRDRARQINGTITIDSDPGEGTRISLNFVYPDANQSLPLRAIL